MLDSQTNLADETIRNLQKLIQANIDSVNGFQEAADEIDNVGVQTLFRELAAERATFADDLQQYVVISGEEAETDGSLAATLHRIWMNIRASLTSEDTAAILNEAERGEDYIKNAYEETLKDIPGSPLNDVLQHQYMLIKKGHDRVKALRDSFND